jgi:hypothetical protein
MESENSKRRGEILASRGKGNRERGNGRRKGDWGLLIADWEDAEERDASIPRRERARLPVSRCSGFREGD